MNKGYMVLMVSAAFVGQSMVGAVPASKVPAPSKEEMKLVQQYGPVPGAAPGASAPTVKDLTASDVQAATKSSIDTLTRNIDTNYMRPLRRTQAALAELGERVSRIENKLGIKVSPVAQKALIVDTKAQPAKAPALSDMQRTQAPGVQQNTEMNYGAPEGAE